jgi:TatD DNase family protein
MYIIDTHTHLYSEEFTPDLDKLLEEASALDVKRFYMPNIESSSVAPMLMLEKKYPGICIPMMGLHPCSVKANWKVELEEVEQWWSKRMFSAVGEIGIDLYWDKTYVEEQKIVFRRQIELADAYKKPVVIHTRESFDVTYELLKEINLPSVTGIFHCFSGTVEQARKAIDLGFSLGIGGVVTFKNGGLDKVLPEIGMEHIVLETDAPYLAPAPYRGKRNIPSYILKVAEKISEIKNISVMEVAEVTTRNAEKIFGQTI